MRKQFLELIRLAATELPTDVTLALESAARREPSGSLARSVLEDVLGNCRLASESSRPLCQDTGTNIWYLHHPRTVSQAEMKREILAATRAATKKAYLRPNAVDPITGLNSGDNTGFGAPVMHFHEWNRKSIAADLLLKGGGSENVSALYALPNASLKAGRDLDGVRRVVIDAVFQAQGKGCGPGIIGVGIGGDRATSMEEAKEQLLRLIDDTNPNPVLADLEDRITKECNELEIGPMGFGGLTTVLGTKVGYRHRLPASYFVAVAYLCWAGRRAHVTINEKGAEFSPITILARKYELPGRVRGRNKRR
ncbi:MAG: fumarate hydratase [Proteobacteria bacterium]|nr:fumarate hydratase [Pseudomonadota bacterium]